MRTEDAHRVLDAHFDVQATMWHCRRCNGDGGDDNDDSEDNDDDDDEDNDVHAARSVWSRNLIPRLDQHSLPRSYTCPALTNDDDDDDDSGFDDFDDYFDDRGD